jgi:hypothetical protein
MGKQRTPQRGFGAIGTMADDSVYEGLLHEDSDEEAARGGYDGGAETEPQAELAEPQTSRSTMGFAGVASHTERPSPTTHTVIEIDPTPSYSNDLARSLPDSNLTGRCPLICYRLRATRACGGSARAGMCNSHVYLVLNCSATLKPTTVFCRPCQTQSSDSRPFHRCDPNHFWPQTTAGS